MQNPNEEILIRSKKFHDLSQLTNEGSIDLKHRAQSCIDLSKLTENNKLITEERLNSRSSSTTKLSKRERRTQKYFTESSPNKTLYNPSPKAMETQSMSNSTLI